MRRLLVALLLCLSATAWFGVSHRSAALEVDGVSVSNAELASELRTVSNTPVVQCYLSELYQNNFSAGAARNSLGASAVAAWVSGRVEGIAIRQYVAQHFHHRPTASELATATSAFEGELTALATQHSLRCPGTSAQAVAAMPAAMRSMLLTSQADSLYLIAHVKGTVPLTVPSLLAYYHQHLASYTATCISVALVPRAKVSAFEAAVHGGLSLEASAAQYSVDPSAKKGGVYGCLTPSSTAYAAVQADVAGLPRRTWSKPFSYQGGAYGLFVAVRSTGVQPFSAVASTVLTDVRNANAASASTLTSNLLAHSSVHVDPSLGVWGLSSTGLGVGPLAQPAAANVDAAKLFTATTAPTYQ
jgi:hypothetical protein